MSAFTATNGIEVTDLGGKWDRTTIQFEGKTQNVDLRRTVTFEDDDLTALREWDIARRDEELGRWRWPENPDYVVYPLDECGQTVVLRESTGHNITFLRGQVNKQGSDYAQCALAFFEAHPEQKPWQDAKVGEVWVLSTADGETAAYSVLSVRESGIVFESHEGRYSLADADIESARRIWPEETP